MYEILAKAAAACLCTTTLAVAGTASASNAGTKPIVVSVPCSATALASAITSASNGEILQLTRFCTYQLTAPLFPISTNLTIRGNQATIERSLAPSTPDFTILDVPLGDELTIRYLTFRDAVANEQGAGGAIENAGSLTITGGSFVGNRTIGYGGAIDNSGTLKVTGTTFRGNMSADGGAIENLSVAHITDSQFRDNQATFNGGAFHNEGRATVTDSVFTGNAAAADGGGIFVGVDGNVSTIKGTTVSRNRAIDGGGIYNEDTVSLADTLIASNRGSDEGGGIFSDWILTGTNSQIIFNTAAAGGGIYNGDLFGPPGSVTLTGSAVLANQPDNCEPANTIGSCTDPAAVGQRLRASAAGRVRLTALARGRALARDFFAR